MYIIHLVMWTFISICHRNIPNRLSVCSSLTYHGFNCTSWKLLLKCILCCVCVCGSTAWPHKQTVNPPMRTQMGIFTRNATRSEVPCIPLSVSLGCDEGLYQRGRSHQKYRRYTEHWLVRTDVKLESEKSSAVWFPKLYLILFGKASAVYDLTF